MSPDGARGVPAHFSSLPPQAARKGLKPALWEYPHFSLLLKGRKILSNNP